MYKLEGCGLTKIQETPVSGPYNCATYFFPEERILFCDGDKCQSFNGKNNAVEPDPIYGGHAGPLANYKGNPMLVGNVYYCGNNCGPQAEIMELPARKWKEIAPYPVAQARWGITDYATVSTPNSAIIIGGLDMDDEGYDISDIMEYKDGEWTKLGDVLDSRTNHVAISNGKQFIIAGGYYWTKDCELWDLDGSNARAIPPAINTYNYNQSFAFLVDLDFCLTN